MIYICRPSRDGGCNGESAAGIAAVWLPRRRRMRAAGLGGHLDLDGVDAVYLGGSVQDLASRAVIGVDIRVTRELS